MSESRRDELLKKYLGPVGASDVIIESGLSVDGTKQTTDGWILPLSETLRVRELRESIIVSDNYYQRDDFESFSRLELTKLTSVCLSFDALQRLNHNPALASLTLKVFYF